MSITTIDVHDVETIKVQPVSAMDMREYNRGTQYKQKIIVECEDGSTTTFTAFFSDAINRRKDSEKAAGTVTGALR